MAPEFNGQAMVDKVLSELAVSGGPFVLVIDDLHELSSGYGENAWASSTSIPPNSSYLTAFTMISLP